MVPLRAVGVAVVVDRGALASMPASSASTTASRSASIWARLQRPDRAQRVDARAEQRLVGVDVPDAGDPPWSSRNAFTGACGPRAGARSASAVKSGLSGSGAEARVEVLVERVAAEQHDAGAEAALVDEQQPLPVVEHERTRRCGRSARSSRSSRRLPVMRRCMTRWTSSSSSIDQVLAAAAEPLDPRARAARRRSPRAAPGRDQSGSSTWRSSRRPSSAGASWRRIVSTSGSSGIRPKSSRRVSSRRRLARAGAP